MFASVFFDLDGTLTDSAPGIAQGVQRALAYVGIQEEDPAMLRRFMGPPLFYAFQTFYGLTPEQSQECVDVYRQYYREEGIFNNRLYDGVIPMLEALRSAGKRLFICTSKPETMAHTIADHFGIRPYFSGIVGATLGTERCEKPQLLQYLLDHYGPVSTCVMVGDRFYDVQGAHAVGIPACGALWGYGSAQELEEAGADILAESPQQLVNKLQEVVEPNGGHIHNV